jgi:bifunctional DNA-binding transcriptional regulator/antitoxin component of YhaV-PrlF toxin-antitoxin module
MEVQSRKTIDTVLREPRQITLPAEICEQLGLQTGDRLEAPLEADTLVVQPKRSLALRALSDVQAAFAASGITEAELQAEGRRVREKLYGERYVEQVLRPPA